MQKSHKHTSLISTGMLVIIITVVVKIVSLLKEVIFSNYFGTTAVSDSYFTSNIIPNLLNGSLVVSILMFFIPLYMEIKHNSGHNRADYFVSNALTVYTSISIVLMITLMLLSENISGLLAQNSQGIDVKLTARLLRLSCLSFPITMIAWTYTHLLNANNKFIVPQLLTLLNIGVSIVGMCYLHRRVGILAVPISSFIAWIMQALIQAVYSRRVFKFSFVYHPCSEHIKRTVFLAGPVFISQAADQLNLSVDNVIALSFLAGTVSVLNYSQKIFNLINGVLSTSLLTVSYPMMAATYSKEGGKEFAELVARIASIIILIMCPVTLLCTVLSKEIVQVIYLRGIFSMEDVIRTTELLQPYIIALPFVALKELYNRVFYIQQDSKTPLIITLISISVNIALSIMFSFMFGIKGVAYATTIASVIALLMELLFLKRKEKISLRKNSLTFVGQMTLSLLLMLVVLLIVKAATESLSAYSKLIITSITTTLVYMAGLLLTKNKIAIETLELILNKSKRSKKNGQ